MNIINTVGWKIISALLKMKDYHIQVDYKQSNPLAELVMRKLNQLGQKPTARVTEAGWTQIVLQCQDEHVFAVLDNTEYFIIEVLGESNAFDYDYESSCVTINVGICTALVEELNQVKGVLNPLAVAADRVLYRTIPGYLEPSLAARENAFMLA